MKCNERNIVNIVFNSAGLLSGVVLGSLLMMMIYTGSHAETETETDQALKLFSTALDQVERNSYQEMTTKEVVFAGIHGMFRTLDPYTHFLDEESFDYMRAQQEGSFYGIGISFDIRDGQLLVISPIEDSPAWDLGMQAGDIIVEIEGKSTAGITSADVLSKLRGKKGTKVKIAIKRNNVPEPLQFEIIRGKITLNSIRGGFMIGETTGYIRITEFSSTTARDLLDKLKELKSQGMQHLILDLRFNGGGLLAAAEDVSSIFLEKGKLIVSTRGRDSNNHMELQNRRTGPFVDLPLIILVNESSASASEIVAGAIQDHDRGLVVGATTHGKGLVGSQFPNKLGTAIQITSAQYFTPSGRYIQKPYSIPHREALHRKSTATSEDENLNIHYTSNGRKVFGGGGIKPDVILEDTLLSPNMIMLENLRIFFDYAVDHAQDHVPVTPEITITDDIHNDFLDYCRSIKNLKFIEEELGSDKTAIMHAIKREFLSVQINTTEGEKFRVKNLTIIQEARKLFENLSSYLTPDPA